MVVEADESDGTFNRLPATIAIVTNMLAPYRIPLFRALAARPEVSRLTVLVCVDKERDRDWTVTSEPGFEVVRCWGLSLQRTIGGDRLRVVHLRFGVMQWLATQRPDHVLIGDASWTSYLATLACRVLGIPYSVWSEITPVSRVSDGLAGRLRRWMYGGAHRCVAASGEAARFLAGQGVPELRIRRAINAVDVTQLQTAAARWWPERHAVRSSLGIPPDAFVFLYVGQFIARKRVKETVALLEQAAAKHPVHLILAGSGPLEHALREQTVACQHLTTSFVGFVEGDALWLWLRVRTPADGPHWLLEVDLPGVDEVRVHYRDAAGQWVVQRAGDQLPQSAWPRRGRAPTFLLSPRHEEAVDYWVRVRHHRVPFSADLWLKTDTRVAEENSRAQFLLGAYFGLTTLALLVAAAQAITRRDRGFAAYVPYIGAMALAQAGMTGLGGELFWPEWPELNHPATFFMPLFAGAAGTWFVRVIANPRQHSELLDRMTLAFIAVMMAVALADLIWPSIPGFEFSMMLLSASMLLVLLMLGVALARGDSHARWVSAGFAFVILGGLAPVARNFGLLESGFLTEYGLMLGSALEIPVLFYALHRRLTEQTESP